MHGNTRDTLRIRSLSRERDLAMYNVQLLDTTILSFFFSVRLEDVSRAIVKVRFREKTFKKDATTSFVNVE